MGRVHANGLISRSPIKFSAFKNCCFCHCELDEGEILTHIKNCNKKFFIKNYSEIQNRLIVLLYLLNIINNFPKNFIFNEDLNKYTICLYVIFYNYKAPSNDKLILGYEQQINPGEIELIKNYNIKDLTIPIISHLANRISEITFNSLDWLERRNNNKHYIEKAKDIIFEDNIYNFEYLQNCRNHSDGTYHIFELWRF